MDRSSAWMAQSQVPDLCIDESGASPGQRIELITADDEHGLVQIDGVIFKLELPLLFWYGTELCSIRPSQLGDGCLSIPVESSLRQLAQRNQVTDQSFAASHIE